MSMQHVDDEALRELQVIMGDDFNNLLKTFVTDSTARIAAAEQALAAADGEALRRAAHSFKGSSGNMGAPRLSDLCRRIEELAHGGDIHSCIPLLDEVSAEFEIVQCELARFERSHR